MARAVKPGNIEKTMRYLANHKPEGHKSGTCGFELVAQYVHLQFFIGYLTAQADTRPVWNEGDFFGTKFGRGGTWAIMPRCV